MGKKVHVFKEDFLYMQKLKNAGWVERKRFGDLVEMEEPELQRAINGVKQKLLTLKSGIERMFYGKAK